MWAQIAAELAAPCSEVEWIHWDLGKTQMEKRGSDDSFSTIRFDLSPPQVDDARLQARRQHQDQQQQQQQQQQRANSEWSGHEETSLFAYRRSGMLWEDISKLLSGRTVTSCQAYFYRQAAIGPGWSQERKNKLCKLYDSLKPSMWAKIGEELKVRWEVAEDMHWRLGAVEMAQRAGVPLSTQATFRLAPLEHDIDNAEVHQHRDQEDDELSRHYHPIHPPLSETEPALMAHEAWPGTSVTLPCFADFAAGVELPF
ncbi:hypothetical protein E4U27_007023 [Claviceps purpurea]|nr:hypothetical protein E4U27_007023 [Claviceps purpurea]